VRAVTENRLPQPGILKRAAKEDQWSSNGIAKPSGFDSQPQPKEFRSLRAIDQFRATRKDGTSGEMLAEIELPANATGAPITYMAGGKQYIAFPTGGGPLPEELIAVAL
jgi:hypothetical protein